MVNEDTTQDSTVAVHELICAGCDFTITKTLIMTTWMGQYCTCTTQKVMQWPGICAGCDFYIDIGKDNMDGTMVGEDTTWDTVAYYII